MKKFRSLICIVLVLLLSGCKKDLNSVPYNEFESIMGKEKYVLTNTTSNYSYALEAYAYISDLEHIEFITTKKINEAKGMYMEDFTNVYNEVSSQYKGEILNDDNWSTYKVKTDSKCYFLFLYDKTYIYVEMNIIDEAKFERIVNELLS